MPLAKGAYLRIINMKRFKSVRSKTKTFNVATKSNMKQSKQISKNQKAIKRLKKLPERKFTLLNRIWATSISTIIQTPLDVMIKGTSDGQRIGDEISLQNIMINFNMQSGGGIGIARAILLLDRQNNNSTSLIPASLLFVSVSTNRDICGSAPNPDFVGKDKRFSFIFDTNMIVLDTIVSPLHFRANIRKWLGHRVHFSSNSGTSADVIDKCVSLYIITADANMIYSFSSVLNYTDS